MIIEIALLLQTSLSIDSVHAEFARRVAQEMPCAVDSEIYDQVMHSRAPFRTINRLLREAPFDHVRIRMKKILRELR